jgi:hypothetical protein
MMLPRASASRPTDAVRAPASSASQNASRDRDMALIPAAHATATRNDA